MTLGEMMLCIITIGVMPLCIIPLCTMPLCIMPLFIMPFGTMPLKFILRNFLNLRLSSDIPIATKVPSRNLPFYSEKSIRASSFWCHDIQQNDTWHNDTWQMTLYMMTLGMNTFDEMLPGIMIY